jgi:hypothetical protein
VKRSVALSKPLSRKRESTTAGPEKPQKQGFQRDFLAEEFFFKE